ncbi:hypothetical protein M0805_001390 [Coniferiporia weirii]|nr:hypothetical protein M0805_001390 [Coniferiporia weirii]
MPYFRSVTAQSSLAPPSDEDALPLPFPAFPRDVADSEHTKESLDAFNLAQSPSTSAPHLSESLPLAHVTSVEGSRSSKSRKKRGTRADHGLRVHWARFLRRVGNGDDVSSESIAAGSTERSSAEVARERHDVEIDVGADMDYPDDKSVDVVVVDRSWGRSLTGSDMSEDDSGPDRGTTDHFDHGGTMSSGGRESPTKSRAGGFWGLCLLLTIARYRLWPMAVEFFSARFYEKKAEEHYRKEIWFQSKPLALWSSLFFVINWILGCALVPKPFTLADNIFYFGISPVLTLPIPFFVIFDFARDRTYIYHSLVTLSTWSWSIYQIIYIFACGYYSGDEDLNLPCGSKDFLSLFYYTTGLQTIALFGLKLNRLPAMMGAMVFLVMSASMVIPYRIGWIRNDLNFVIFQLFLLYIHYMKETGERRLYTLQDQLKKQFKATQKAQVNERKASESKRRLTSYVFHDKSESHSIQRSSLSRTWKLRKVMMSKVLNDVLDFNRMDSGLLESVAMPYPLHAVMRSMFIPLQLATDARQLHFTTELDKDIDIAARRAAWESLSAQNKLHVQDGCDNFEKHLDARPDDDGIVVGDEMRLRQIVTNLVSNACKFTPAGGTLAVRTRLIAPNASTPGSSVRRGSRSGQTNTDAACVNSRGHSDCDPEKGECAGLSVKSLDQHNASHRKGAVLDRIIVRIEVSDTGYGIKAKDITKGKLFSAFNQTEQGRLQGGKGTGLGLALVRHIVSLSGGRLGVRSKVGEGSTFWVELPLGVGRKAVSGTISTGSEHDGSSTFVGQRTPARNGSARLSSVPRAPPSTGSSRHNTDASETAVGGSSRNSYAPPSSVLKSIMEQGGLVELAPTRHTDGEHQIPTRAIGDPSTGTDASSNGGPPSPHEGDANPAELIQRIGNHESTSSAPPGRPHYVELPKRPSFALPNRLPAVAGTDTRSSPRPDALDSPLRVLVVDDDQLTRRLMKRMLQRMGCTVSTAENGQIAYDLIIGEGRTPASETGEAPAVQPSPSSGPLQELANHREYEGPRYELVFLDNQMPVLSGIDLVAKLRQLGRTDFIVGVTGNALLSDQEEYQEAGVNYVITKPVFEVSLKGMLGIAAERRKNYMASPRLSSS